jgi:hypothetical protein
MADRDAKEENRLNYGYGCINLWLISALDTMVCRASCFNSFLTFAVQYSTNDSDREISFSQITQILVSQTSILCLKIKLISNKLLEFQDIFVWHE